MLVMCPATPNRRLMNGCKHTCSHFHPHEFLSEPSGCRDSCLQISGIEGEAICPQCTEATEEVKATVYTNAVANRMVDRFKEGKGPCLNRLIRRRK
jgi:hypothetical protein